MDFCIAVASDPPVDYWFATYRILSQQNSWDVTKVLTVWTWRMYMYEQNFRHLLLIKAFHNSRQSVGYVSKCFYNFGRSTRWGIWSRG